MNARKLCSLHKKGICSHITKSNTSITIKTLVHEFLNDGILNQLMELPFDMITKTRGVGEGFLIINHDTASCLYGP